MALPLRGFILQPTYRIERGRTVVHLYGKLESGEPFLVRDHREKPHFYVAARHTERARELGATPLAPTALRSLAGEPVVRIEVPTPPDTPPLRDRLFAAGIPCLEADVRFAMRYLMDRGIQGSLAIRGEGKQLPGVGWVFEDPELAPADYAPRLSVLSLDIETDPQGRRLLSVAFHGPEVREVLMIASPSGQVPPAATLLPGERELLRATVRRIVELDPDVLTGWNVVGFDLAVLARRAADLQVPFAIGRGAGTLRFQSDRGPRGGQRAVLPGRMVLDGIDLLRGAFVRMEEFSLDFVAREVLGEGKLISGHDRGEEILRLWREDPAHLAEYNLKDARLVSQILERLQLVELAVARSLLTGLPLDRVSGSIAAFDFLYLSRLGKRGYVAPSVAAEAPEDLSTAGGHVLEPLPGLYRNALVFDFKSLYPSLIRTFGIDPLGLVRRGQTDPDPVVAPNGAAFRREPGILPQLLEELFPRREEARRAGDKIKSQAIKILMNSFYGVLATPACRFADPLLGNAITSFGKEVLLWSKRRLESWGYQVLYGDTDSLFVASGQEDSQAAQALGEELVERLNRELATYIEGKWRVPSKLEIEFERLYLALHLLSVRHGSGGARKRYAGWVEEDGERQVVFTGLESVRRDATELAKRVQKGLYERLFTGQPVEPFLRETVADLRAGRLDEQLVYRKALRKPAEAYTATTPPHVAAARKAEHSRKRGLISYVMTTAGAEPASERHHPFDYDHYVDKQIQPVAEPVLALLGLEFRKATGEDRQLALF
ncbi:MAG: DNA polymerase II [Thermoanaerobaculia bacterium]